MPQISRGKFNRLPRTTAGFTTSEKVVFDPNAASSKGSVAVDFYVPSLDGKYVAAALSENGSEDASGHVFEVATGKELTDAVPRQLRHRGRKHRLER